MPGLVWVIRTRWEVFMPTPYYPPTLTPAKTAPPPPPPLDTNQALIFKIYIQCTMYIVHNAVLQKTQSKWVSKWFCNTMHPNDKHGMIMFMNETVNCMQRTVQWLPIKHGSGSRHQREQPGFAVSVSSWDSQLLNCSTVVSAVSVRTKRFWAAESQHFENQQ